MSKVVEVVNGVEVVVGMNGNGKVEAGLLTESVAAVTSAEPVSGLAWRSHSAAAVVGHCTDRFVNWTNIFFETFCRAFSFGQKYKF